MKGYTIAALTSLVSAMKPDLVDQTELPALSMATCYGFAHEKFYDLTDFNKAFRDYDNWYPWYVDMGNGNTFYYKTCQASWAMTS